ncbi:MAG: peptide chain release factor N(5)-glutamine methyltransferase [Gemmiger sp.]|nr:peptide chain release factor N(5)-glutamine methyltransferase [Gemmiger sp.]
MVSLIGLPPRAAVRAVQATLQAAGCPDADFDARELYRLATGQDSRLSQEPLAPPQAEKLAGLALRRAAREPLQYLAGQWGFHGLELAVGPGVLCPRPDSEVVCEAALACLAGAGPAAPLVLDLCAGTGCLGLAIKAACPGARVVCVEKSPAAFAYLQQNAAAALPGYTPAHPAVECVAADIFTYHQTLAAGAASLVVSNPPYLTAAEMAQRMPETAREPALALDGGADGLDFYRLLVTQYRACLAPGGWLVLEIGCAQAAAVMALGRAAGWQNVHSQKDYGGNDRVVLLQKNEFLGHNSIET